MVFLINYRVPLEQTVLECKSYAPDERIGSFLSELPEPPSEKAIRFAVNDLIEIGKKILWHIFLYLLSEFRVRHECLF